MYIIFKNNIVNVIKKLYKFLNNECDLKYFCTIAVVKKSALNLFRIRIQSVGLTTSFDTLMRKIINH